MGHTATTLEEAIAQTNSRVAQGNAASLLNQQITTFNSLWGPEFDKEKEKERTVRNWFVQANLVRKQTPTQGNAQERQDVVNIACRVMYATIAAEAAGRITSAQRDSVLAAWNNSFGVLPP